MLVFAWLFKIVVFIFVLGTLVFVHEFGHFIVAKFCGVGVLKFSLGFGKPLFSFRHKETTYQVAWIPLGGYVRMVGDIPDMITGEEDTDKAVRDGLKEDLDLKEVSKEVKEAIEDRSKWFIEQGFLKKFSIVLAGPLFNFIFAWLVFSFSSYVYGVYSVNDSPTIGEVMKDSPAFKVGLEEGDKVSFINGIKVKRWKELASIIHKSEGETLNIKFKRGNIDKEVSVVPQLKELPTDRGKKVFLVGISPSLDVEKISFFYSPISGVIKVWEFTSDIYISLWSMIGAASAKDLAGPIFIFQAAGAQAEAGIENLLGFMALLSLSLGVLNLLPIPILDGGHLMFFILEALIGPISIRKKEFAQQVGMFFLFSLMIFAVYNDITRKMPEGDGFTWEDSKSKEVKDENLIKE